MPGKAANVVKVVVSKRQWVILEEFRRSKTEPQFVSERAAIIIGAFAGRSNQEVAQEVGLERHAVGVWRWLASRRRSRATDLALAPHRTKPLATQNLKS